MCVIPGCHGELSKLHGIDEDITATPTLSGPRRLHTSYYGVLIVKKKIVGRRIDRVTGWIGPTCLANRLSQKIVDFMNLTMLLTE
jgi:hypothetical protein